MREPTRCSEKFQKGVKEFMRMAINCVDGRNMTRCPCRDCANRYYQPIDLVEAHLYMNGFTLMYTRWIFHGEDLLEKNTSTNIKN